MFTARKPAHKLAHGLLARSAPHAPVQNHGPAFTLLLGLKTSTKKCSQNKNGPKTKSRGNGGPLARLRALLAPGRLQGLGRENILSPRPRHSPINLMHSI
jgi:hypothetical protein